MTWLAKLHGKFLVVKLGGNAMLSEDLLVSFARDIAAVRRAGVLVAVVHGGGPQITRALENSGIPSSFVDGLRVTPLEAMPIIQDVLMNQISMPLVELLEQSGVEANALNGITEDLFIAEVTKPELGRVGEVFAVRDGYLREIMQSGVVPVISSVAPAEDGKLVNVNADLAAAAVAISLGAEELVMLTDVDGLYADFPNKESLIAQLTVSELEKLLPTLESGMLPKVEACLTACFGGVKLARIVNGSVEHPISKLEQDQNLGTTITA